MKYITCEIPEKTAYIIPISDLHIGDQSFSKEGQSKLMGYIDWIKERPNARVIIPGDVFNVAGRETKTSPFENDTGEYKKAIALFEPIKDRIIAVLDGNHEARMLDMFGISPAQLFCMKLEVPYCGWSAVIRLKVGKRTDGPNRWHENYFIYAHHTTGGGSTVGSKLNRVAKLRDIVEGIDVYLGGHNHQLAVAPVEVYYPSMQGKCLEKRRIWYVDCGSYTEWNDSYAEKAGMGPTKLGSPRIRFDSKSHDVHISL